jgi:hypothetical protein
MLVSVARNQVPDIEFDSDVPTSVSPERLERLLGKTGLKGGDFWFIRLPSGKEGSSDMWQIKKDLQSQDSFTTTTGK